MNIKFNEVTWYSKLLAVILFVAVAVLFFYFGAQNIIIENGLDGSSPAFYYSLRGENQRVSGRYYLPAGFFRPGR